MNLEELKEDYMQEAESPNRSIAAHMTISKNSRNIILLAQKVKGKEGSVAVALTAKQISLITHIPIQTIYSCLDSLLSYSVIKSAGSKPKKYIFDFRSTELQTAQKAAEAMRIKTQESN